MTKIKVLNEKLANMIAAGEVVEKCVSVVKELIENSIDAKSKQIKIELIESGIKEIKVIDDGTGIEKEDALLAFLPHATSKIITEDDLFHIVSLGFRGEALASIASVSTVELKTSTGGVGTTIVMKAGKMIENKSSDSRQGTEITVKNLFYNTPARLKHLGTLYYELANIIEYINKIALSYPEIAFSLKNDNKEIFKTDGSNNLLKVINEIYGLNVSKNMIAIANQNDDYQISGYISKPEITKSNRNHFNIIVNNRIIKNLEINKTINDAYHTFKPEDKYPIIVLKIQVDPRLIDVNIHPTKMDIKFSKKESLQELITFEIKNKLNSINLIPTIENKSLETFISNPEVSLEIAPKQYDESSLFTIAEEPREYNEPLDELKPEKKVPHMEPVGVVHGTYLIFQDEDNMYLIDQHAAKERVNYEFYLKQLGSPNNHQIEMLFPINLEFPNNEFLLLKQNINLLKQLGFGVEELGKNSLVFRYHPLWLPKNYEEVAIKKICELVLSKEKDFQIEKFNEKIAIMMSCKLAIKANEKISIKEMEQLIEDLRNCQNPYTCPHGRPTIISYSRYELEKLFKRAV